MFNEDNGLKGQGWFGGYGHRLSNEINSLINNGRINELPAQAQKDLIEWNQTRLVDGSLQKFTGLPKSLLKLKGRYIIDYILDVFEKFKMPLIAYVNLGQGFLMSEVLEKRGLEYVLADKEYGHKWGDIKKDLENEGKLFIFHGDVLYSENLIRRILKSSFEANVVTSISTYDNSVKINDKGFLTKVKEGFWEFFHGQGYYNNEANSNGFRFSDAVRLFCEANPDTCNEYGEDSVYPFAIKNGLTIRVLIHKPSELININDINDYSLAYDSV